MEKENSSPKSKSSLESNSDYEFDFSTEINSFHNRNLSIKIPIISDDISQTSIESSIEESPLSVENKNSKKNQCFFPINSKCKKRVPTPYVKKIHKPIPILNEIIKFELENKIENKIEKSISVKDLIVKIEDDIINKK